MVNIYIEREGGGGREGGEREGGIEGGREEETEQIVWMLIDQK